VLGPSLRNVLLALCVVGWTGYARLVRGEVLAWRQREFVGAAVALGAPPLRVLAHHIVPQLLPVLMVQASFGMAGAVVAEASLSFLGLGVQPPTPSWGAMVNEGRSFLLIAPHIALFPGLAIMLTVLGLNFLGDGLRDMLDVRGGEMYGAAVSWPSVPASGANPQRPATPPEDVGAADSPAAPV
jgi:peptide/nickel transport system permease protein